ncbi:MAG: hypothetical protein A2283_21740 [Lentisphaerae bacterium RIFOXYA12_FULL_48_11]|nr:MAG: hypothetical protein A2283_21740 [Lentisphaerae bacterium RIFOXYA12_FULL_48_11]
MSVLTKLVREREEWINRQKVLVARNHQAKMIMDYVTATFICMLPFIVFMFRDKILLMMRYLVN